MGGKGKRSKENLKKQTVKNHRQHKTQQRDSGFDQGYSLPVNQEVFGMLKNSNN